jgi:hypothetical protein
LSPHANPLTPQVLPRDKEGVVRRLAVRPAASPFFGEGVEGRGKRGAGLVRGTWISAPWFWASSGELVDAVAPSVAPAIADVLAAQPGQRRRGRPELEGEPLDLHQPLVLGLLDLVAEDIAVGAHETEVRPQIHSNFFLIRSSTSATYPTPNCRANSAGSVVGLWQA